MTQPIPKSSGSSVDSPTQVARFGDARDWWFERRFGLFVHWGLYALNGFHEQEQWRRRVSRTDYARLAERWNPVGFSPDAWLDLAESAGMKYLCFTTKHHDGFCLWDTKLTSFNTMNTPFGRDVLRELAAACQRRKFPLCLYYSVVDWRHPDYPNQGRHHELPAQPEDRPDPTKYLEFVRGQVRELCTGYGPIHGFWWDMNVAGFADPSINAMIRELQPQAVINNRGFDAGDFGTPERDYDDEGRNFSAFTQRTEACQSVGQESWGYRTAEAWYTDRHLLRSVDKYRARGANYLLNVGPDANAAIPGNVSSLLGRIGAWYRAVEESFSGTPAPALTSNQDVLLTRRGADVYVHLVQEPVTDMVSLKPLSVAPRRATLLNDGREVEWSLEMLPSNHLEQRGYLHLRNLPVNEFSNSVLVIKLEFERLPENNAAAASAADAGTEMLR